MPSTVQNIIKDAAGNVVGGASVTIDLVVLSGGSDVSVQGFYPSTDFSINIPATVSTNSSGVWSIANLPGNNGIEDASGVLGTTHWKITEIASNIPRVYYIKFGEGAPSPIWAGDYTDKNVVVPSSTFPNAVGLSVGSLTITSALSRTNIGTIIDASFATELRFDARVRTSTAGNLLIQYSLDNATWTTLGSVPTSSTGVVSTGYLSIPGSMRTVGIWQLATSGGTNGTSSIDFATINYR